MSTLQEILMKKYDLEDGDILLDDIYVPPKVAVNHLNTLVRVVNHLQKENEKLQHQLEIQTRRVENLKALLFQGDELKAMREWIFTSDNVLRHQAIDQELEKQLEEVK